MTVSVYQCYSVLFVFYTPLEEPQQGRKIRESEGVLKGSVCVCVCVRERERELVSKF